MNSQKMTNCKKYNTAESVGPLSLLLTSSGMELGTPVDIQASEDAAVVLSCLFLISIYVTLQ